MNELLIPVYLLAAFGAFCLVFSITGHLQWISKRPSINDCQSLSEGQLLNLIRDARHHTDWDMHDTTETKALRTFASDFLRGSIRISLREQAELLAKLQAAKQKADDAKNSLFWLLPNTN